MKSTFLVCSRFFGLILLACTIGCSSGSGKEDILNAKHHPSVHTIEIIQMKFVPSELTVQQGDTILFINNDMVAHDITEETSKAWHSSPMNPGQRWKMEVDKSIQYICSIHPVMKGKIVVE